MDTGWLEDFLALAELRNFSRAAQLRNITQPAFGRHIRALEESIGQKLVDRSSSPVTLTPAGYQFRLIAHSMVNQLKEGIQKINGLPSEMINPVRFSAPHSLSSPFLLDLIDRIDPTTPFSVDILRVDFAVESLIEGASDFLLAFDTHALLQPPFTNLLLGKGNLLLVSAADDQGLPLFTPDENHQQPVPYLRYSPDSYSARMVERLMPQQPFACQPVFESSLCDLHRQMALRAKGLAWLPDCQIENELAEGKLVAVNRSCWHIPYQIRLYRNQAQLHQRAETFWHCLSQQITQGISYWPPVQY
ncbi:LysR family transcriptional regulator [Hafnia alvei]|uniref:LysR family transcriptional regulator n=1 Tax=Hafnia alvei TaxID=569 RepID=UPI000DAAEBDE|nr:LysR family transcriptional regulator [Hafnia alvei]AWV46237.1 LysR family transcriptional regulator [Hafnia alvei]